MYWLLTQAVVNGDFMERRVFFCFDMKMHIGEEGLDGLLVGEEVFVGVEGEETAALM